jgi:transposase, IS30 family
MGDTYKHLDIGMRDRIANLKNNDGCSARAIAVTLGISHSTVSREIKRNSYGSDNRTPKARIGKYNSSRAEHKAYVRRKASKYQARKIEHNPELLAFIKSKLEAYWNPDEISGYIKLNKAALGFYASKTLIYTWVYSIWGEQYTQYLYSRNKKPKPRKKLATGTRTMIKDRTSIDDRPDAANTRTELGHWEHDTVVSSKRSKSKAALAVASERRTRLVVARKIQNLKPKPYAGTVVAMVKPYIVVSSTTDNGIENKQHKLVTASLPNNPIIYFTDPYSSWQKGGVENANKMIRRYFPKGTDFSKVSQAQIDTAISIINNKPRRCLGYKSALQYAVETGLILNNNLIVSGALEG